MGVYTLVLTASRNSDPAELDSWFELEGKVSIKHGHENFRAASTADQYFEGMYGVVLILVAGYLVIQLSRQFC